MAEGRLLTAYLGEQPDAPAEIEPVLEAMLAAGRAELPEIDVDPERFVRFVAQRVTASGEELPGTLAGLPAADLFLACACAGGDSRAMAELERRHFGEVDRVAAVMRAPRGAADEIKQILRTRFFVPEGDRPGAVAEFSGRGDLRSWVRVSAVREVLRLFRRSRRMIGLDEAVLDELAPAQDAESALVKASCRAETAAALRAALAALPVRERMLLRYQLVDGLGITAIGGIYQVHRATVARWLTKIREDLLAETQRLLADKLHLDPMELASLLRVVRSQLDISLVSALGRADPDS